MNNTSEICVRCGLCCVVLQARCPRSEAEVLCTEMGADVEKFVISDMVTDGDDNRVMMRFPCMFLRGRPGKWVQCVAYGKTRPKLCGSYLCRVATQYKIGEISLEEGVCAITRAFWSNDPSVFNWRGGEEDQRVIVKEWMEEMRSRLVAEGIRDEGVIQYRIASGMTPKYYFKTLIDHDLFSMHMVNHDRTMERLKSGLDPTILRRSLNQYLEDDLLKKLNDDMVRVAGMTMCAVLTELRQFVATEEELIIIHGKLREKSVKDRDSDAVEKIGGVPKEEKDAG